MTSFAWYVRKAVLAVSLVFLLAIYSESFFPRTSFGQESPAGEKPPQSNQSNTAEERFQQFMAEDDSETQKAAAKKPADEAPKLTLLELYFAGGLLMYPITALSFIALLFAVERAFALRRRGILPPQLVEELGLMAAQSGGMDPRRAYRLCQQYPSVTSNVIRAMLLKVGRPHSELEHAAAEASDREATRLYGNVRPISLAVTVAPLLGLLGTVQGMIMAFYDTAYAPVGVNKATHLAEGIYVALITTFGGLTVAIPAAILVHYFEGRIVSLFRHVDELAQSLLPQLERYEGKLRVSRQQLSAAPSDAAANHAAAEPRLQPAATRGE